jgi:hypothetical protein
MKVLLFPALLVLAVLCACTTSLRDLPAIDNPTQLTADCDALLQDPALTMLDQDKWPDSIKKLSPVMVNKEGAGIYITTFAETGIGACGYVVSHTKPADTDHYSVSATPYPNIYRFDFKP